MMMTMAMISLTGGQSSLQISSPGEEQRVAAAPRRKLEKQLLLWGFYVGRINRSQGRSPRGVGPSQDGRWHGQGLGRARHPPGCPVAPLWILGSFRNADFLIYFLGIFPAYLNIQKPAQKKTALVALLKTASVRVSFVQIMQE